MYEAQQLTCPFCNFTSNSEVRIQLHVVSEHSQKPSTLVCPLCSDVFREWDVLQNHFKDAHHVKKEYLTEAMFLVDKTDWLALQTISNNSDRHWLECKAQDNDKSQSLFNAKRQLDKDEQPKEQAGASLGHRENSTSPVVRCGKGFSSTWVLKGYQEKIHKDVVTIKAVEKLADEFREERSNEFASVVDDSTKMAEFPSSSGYGESSALAIAFGDAPLSVPNAETEPVKSLGFQMSDLPSSVTDNHMVQMQFNQIVMRMRHRMGLPMPINIGVNMNLPYASAVNMHHPNIPIIIPPIIDPLMASAFGHPMMLGAAVDPNFFAVQQKLLQQQQQLSQQQKRARTRINDDQLKIFRAYFDINNSPTEEQLLEMSDKSGLPLKVIKHWFRNTLFKERQRNKDSPYNFNNPPSTYLNIEEYGKSAKIKITPVIVEKLSTPKNMGNSEVEKKNKSPEKNISDIKR